MGLAIAITLRFRAPSTAETVRTASERIIEHRLGQAVKRIQSRWPVDTGLSKASFRVVRNGPLRYVLENQAARRGREYAGYVHRRGDPTPLRLTLIPRELATAQSQIADDMATQLPGVIANSVRRLAADSAQFRVLNNRLGRIRL